MTEALRFGWRKDPYDPHDFSYKRKVVKLPDRHLIQVLPPILNQHGWGACVGFTFASILAGEAIKDGKEAKFSEWWIYNGARFIEGSLLEDAGCYPRDALYWLNKEGCLLYSYWPYTPHRFDTTAPPSEFKKPASEWPLAAYYRIQGGVEAMCDVIASDHYVGVGTPWPAKWFKTYEGRVEKIGMQESMAGGHEYYFYGFDLNLECFYANNSWSRSYGKDGSFIVPFQAFDFFKYYGGYDAHYLDVHWEGNMNPKKQTFFDRFWTCLVRMFT
jgi:hypothetical protein